MKEKKKKRKILIVLVFTALGFVVTSCLSQLVLNANQRRLETLKANEAAYEATVIKPRQDALQPDIRRCLEQELAPVYAVNPEQVIVEGARLTAEAFKIIVCVEAK
jgi:hypothetical protein